MKSKCTAFEALLFRCGIGLELKILKGMLLLPLVLVIIAGEHCHERKYGGDKYQEWRSLFHNTPLKPSLSGS